MPGYLFREKLEPVLRHCYSLVSKECISNIVERISREMYCCARHKLWRNYGEINKVADIYTPFAMVAWISPRFQPQNFHNFFASSLNNDNCFDIIRRYSNDMYE